MKQKSKGQQTKQLLLSATKELVYEKGCSKMTLNNIMERTGFSKGAIYHYVRSKDELLALVLKERIKDMNDRFLTKVKEGKKELEGPLKEIIQDLPSLQDPQEVTNKIFIYLLGQNDDPVVHGVVEQFYKQAVKLSKQWIVTGQQNGVIPLSVNTDKTAELFILLSYGVRMRSAISLDSYAFNMDDFTVFMRDILRSNEK